MARVHPEILDHQKLPPRKRDSELWAERYEDINAFERHLHRNGTLILKFFLHLSKEEQKKRFLERLENPKKHWKFSLGDLAERKLWDRYMDAYEKAIHATRTEWAPWHVVPADEKWATRATVAFILTSAIRSLGLDYPKVGGEQRKDLERARKELHAEAPKR